MVSQLPKKACPRPFLKWAGGKSRLIAKYQDYFPMEYKNYYEPFLGGGAIFFHLQPRRARLTDINGELITTYLCVRDKVEQLIKLLQEHQRKHNRDYYYHIRASTCSSDVETAARLIYLNKTCFNGLYRVNSQGKFNVPMGRYKNPNICHEEILRTASAALARADIEQRDFDDILNYAQNANDFVYFDPPYHPISDTSYFTSYHHQSFTAKDQERLRDTCVILAKRGVKVMVCNSDCELVRKLYQEVSFKIYTIAASRSINSNAQKRGTMYELLITY